MSEVFPETARHVDRLAFVKSCWCESSNHAPAMFQMNTGFSRPGYPSAGSWVTYGLGADPDKCIVRAWWLAFSREPGAPERTAARDLISRQLAIRRQRGDNDPARESLTDFCHAVFGMNEFVFVE